MIITYNLIKAQPFLFTKCAKKTMKSKTNREEFRPYHLQWYTAIKPSYLCSKPTTNCVFKKLTKKQNIPIIFLFLISLRCYLGNFEIIEKKKMTTIKERKKKQTQTISNSNFKALNGTESLVRGTNQQIKFGTTNILVSKYDSGPISHFLLWKNVFDNFDEKNPLLCSPLPFPSRISKKRPTFVKKCLLHLQWWREKKNAQNTTWCM
jgi:hypothetical protein